MTDTRAVTFDDLRRLSEAEEWFEALDVAFDPLALAPVRIPLLKRFGMELQAIAGVPNQTEAQRLAAARTALAFAWEQVQKPRAKWAGPLVQLGRPVAGS